MEDCYRNDDIRLGTAAIEAAASHVSQAAKDLVLNPSPDLITHRVTRGLLVRYDRGMKDIVDYLHLAAFGCKLLRHIWQDADADADRALFVITELIALEELARKLAAEEEPDDDEKKFLTKIDLWD